MRDGLRIHQNVHQADTSNAIGQAVVHANEKRSAIAL
jgi:hypothetical protein